MAEVTVKQLALVVGTPVEKLLEQLRDAGVNKSNESEMISDSEKLTLLAHLRQSRGEAAGGGSASKKITLRRKRVNEIKTDASGRKKVNVEVRTRRTVVKRDIPAVEAPVVEAASAPPVEPTSQLDDKAEVLAPEAPTLDAPEVSTQVDEAIITSDAEQSDNKQEEAVEVAAPPAVVEEPVVSEEAEAPVKVAASKSESKKPESPAEDVVVAKTTKEKAPPAKKAVEPKPVNKSKPVSKPEAPVKKVVEPQPASKAKSAPAKPAEQAPKAKVRPKVSEPVKKAAPTIEEQAEAAERQLAEEAAANSVAAEVARATQQSNKAVSSGLATDAKSVERALQEQAAAALSEPPKRSLAEEKAFAAAERQAERQVAAERRKEAEAAQKRETERREQQRLLEESQRRAAAEAQQAASGLVDRGSGGGGRKDAKRGKGKNNSDKGSGDTRYGRNQLHVAKEKSGRRKGKSRRSSSSANFESKHAFERPTTPVVKEIEVPETITVAELANKMAVKANEVIKAMMGMGVMATINQILDQDTAILVVEEMGHVAVPMSADDIEAALAASIAGMVEGDASPRPPVVTVMGHVDHGKTSLLDYIRKARVASGEAGGITQHIGAYQTETDRGVITFLDTPGHAAFTAMRARGAQATDIVILVVAADDGVMPQTIEAVKHAKSANVPLIVAVNKMDKEGADPERVRNELSQYDVISEEWGGDTQFIHVSALTGDGIDKLLDSVSLQAEVAELTAVNEGKASGTVIEASLDKGRGPVATVLVQNGVLKRGDILICGSVTGRVRAMFDDTGAVITEAGPSTPVQILGLSSTPNAGDEMLVADDDKVARELAELREGKHRDARLAERKPAKFDDVFSQFKSETPSLNLVVKTDVKGSYEAIRDTLERLTTDEVSIRVVGGGVGGITESDANLAATSGAILVGFNVRADNAARRLVQELGIDLRYYSVIYELIDLAKSIAGGMLAPEIRERIIGNAEVKDVFTSPKFGQIAGCMVIDGVVRKDEPIRVLRDNVVIYEGELESLRRFKDDVKDVHMGTECGIGVKNYTDVKPGDVIEVFERTEVARTL